MPTTRWLLASLLALAAPAVALSAEYDFSWCLPLPQGNPLGGAAFADATTGYAVGKRGAVIRTSDGGESWALATQFPAFTVDLEDVLILAAGELLAAGAPPGIFRSTDQGATWTPVANPSTGRLVDIEVVTGANLSAIGTGGQVLRSTDAGATWSLRPAPGANDLREQWWFDAANGYVVGNFIARRTTDGGQSWQPLTGFAALDPVSEVFFTDALHGLILGDFHSWKTTNGGATWTENGAPNNFLYAGDTIVLGPAHFLAVTNLEGAGIFETTDGGEEWTQLLEAGLGGFLDFDRLADGTLLAVTDDGDTWRSTDSGATWSNATFTASATHRGPIGALGIGPSGRGAAGTSGSPVPPTHWYRTTDGGSTWLAHAPGPPIVFPSQIEYWDADHAIAAGDVGKMWRTTDGGLTWSFALLPGAPSGGSSYHLALAAPGVAFVPCSGQSEALVYRTTDFGATWEPRATGIPLACGLTSVAFLNAQVGFACGYANSSPRLFKTTDGGGTWSPAGTSGLPGWPWDMHWFDAQTGLATVYLNPGGIFRTTNGGASWAPVHTEPSRNLAFSDALHGGAEPGGFAPSGTLLVTEDSGLSWESLLLPSAVSGTALAPVPDGFLVGGASNHVVRVRRVDPTAVDPDPAPAANGLGLAARATASGEFAITFTLPATGTADLAIIDVHGRHVRTLARGEFPGSTAIARPWDGRTTAGRAAASGVYFVRLHTGQDVRAVKALLHR